MDAIYGINVKNKFELFCDEDVDPLDILAQAENAKKTDGDKKKKDDKAKKNKAAKKQVLQQENKNKLNEEIKPEKAEKVSTAPRLNDRPRGSGRPNREPREDNRPPRRREENANQNTERTDRVSSGFQRPERTEGGGFAPRDDGPREGFGRGEGGFGRGPRGARGRGMRGDRGRGRGGFGGKREFDRHSGSERTSGVKPTEKREGSGQHNWGTVKDDIEEQMKDTTQEQEPREDWNPQAEDTENKDPNESTESANPEGGEAEDDEAKQMTLEEWKKINETNRMKSEFKVRKANEGADMSQWKGAQVYKKKPGADSDDEEEEETDEDDDDEDELRNKKLMNDIKITFNDSPRRGRGGRRPRGARGGRIGGGRGERRPNAAPKFDDENDFPSLIKSPA